MCKGCFIAILNKSRDNFMENNGYPSLVENNLVWKKQGKMNTLPVCMYVYFLDIIPALSCLHLSTHTHHGPTHSSFVFVLFIHIVSCSCMSICQSCDHVPPCLFHYVCQPFCLCCPVLSCCVGLSTHH